MALIVAFGLIAEVSGGFVTEPIGVRESLYEKIHHSNEVKAEDLSTGGLGCPSVITLQRRIKIGRAHV